MVLFFKKGHCCIVKQGKHESYDNFLERGNFVVSQKITDRKKYDDIIVKSYVYINIKNGLIYEKKLMDKIEELSTAI